MKEQYKQISWKHESEKIYEMSIQGKTLQEIGDVYGVTREYIRQVLQKYYPSLTKEKRGKMLASAQERKRILEERYQKKGRYTGKHPDDLSRAIMNAFVRKKTNAKRSKWDFNLSFHDVEWNMTCPILGIELDWFASEKSENSPSFDRLDAKKGYEPGNVIVMSMRANRIKNDGTAEEHEKIAAFMRERLK